MSASKPIFDRFVPKENASSLVDDAPGWDGPVNNQQTNDNPDHNTSNSKGQAHNGIEPSRGPTCWKCRGSGLKKKAKKVKHRSSDRTDTDVNTTGKSKAPDGCPVCHGLGYLERKRKQVQMEERLGVITRGRKHPPNWVPAGPTPFALAGDDPFIKTLFVKANVERKDVQIEEPLQRSFLPRKGEELCNLVGQWRILQRVGSHRWTTDDLVTAWVASTSLHSSASKRGQIRYLDLGTGNASVLQMTVWALLRDGLTLVEAHGIEARSEAVSLARRSIEFNMGTPDTDGTRRSSNFIPTIVHSDFRSFQTGKRFDLITGTPPYFRVDFAVQGNQVKEAIIQQGGMPTSKQSAPARCEFRGGVEAYLETAARLLDRKVGRLVVCENWLNHDRVLKAAVESQLKIIRQVQVRGRQGKPVLFVVYVMEVNGEAAELLKGVFSRSSSKDNVARDEVYVAAEDITVRDLEGDWTDAYKKHVMEDMSIPVFH